MTRALLVVPLLLLAGCYYGDPGVVSAPAGSPYSLIGITADGWDTFTVSGDLTHTVVAASAANHDTNGRVGFIVDDPADAYTESCATWTSASDTNSQAGAILAFDGTTFLSVTQNIYGGNRHAINVHRWDLSLPTDQRYTMLASTAPPSLADPSWPLRLCAHAWAGVVEFKVWHQSDPEPDWSDTCCRGAVTGVPTPAGRAGWFAGHLTASGTMVLDQLEAEP